MTYAIMVIGFALMAAHNAMFFNTVHGYCRGNKQPEGQKQLEMYTWYVNFTDGMSETHIKSLWAIFALVMLIATVFWPLTAVYLFWKRI